MIHADEARKRVATQYTESTKFLLALSKLAAQCQNIEDALQSVQQITDIDTAAGVNLDVIGDIVGVSRYIEKSFLFPFFGFHDTPSGLVFGEETVAAVGGRFREEAESWIGSSILQDPEFRTLIRSKIAKNHSIGTGEDLLSVISFVLPSELVILEDVGGMAISVMLGRPVTLIERVLLTQLDLLPRPNGVRLTLRGWFNSERFFGFEGQVSAKTFSEEADPSFGGFFAEEYVL